MHAQSLNHVLLFAAPWTACQPPLSMEFPRQYWNGLPLPTPGDLSDPGIEPASPALAVRFFTTEPRKPEPTYDPAIQLLGIYLEKNSVQKYKCAPVFIAALFTIAKTWKQPKCASTDD